MFEKDDWFRRKQVAEAERLPEDIAEGILFFVSPATRKSTGNILNIDGGNVQSFTR